MSKALEQALEEARKLPESDQDALAEAILAEIQSEQAWEQAFADSLDVLDQLGDEALDEHRSGQTRPLDPSQL